MGVETMKDLAAIPKESPAQMSRTGTILAAYKDIHRAIRKTFSGDQLTLSQAKQLARTEFMKPAEDSKLEERIAEAKETANYLRRNFVQAVKKADNHYKLKLTSEHEINDKILPIKTKRRCC